MAICTSHKGSSHKGKAAFSGMKAFTLTELLIVIAILSILMAMAYPSYRESVIRANRSDAHIMIQRQTMAEERLYAVQNQYSPISAQSSPEGMYMVTSFTGLPPSSGISDCAAVTSDTDATSRYTVIALPVAGKSQASDDKCTCIYMDSLGVKGSTGTRTNPEDCW